MCLVNALSQSFHDQLVVVRERIHSMLLFMFVLSCAYPINAQVHKPTVTRIEMDNENGANHYLFQDSTGLIWLFSTNGDWSISDGERVFPVDKPRAFKKRNSLTWASQINDRFYFSGDSMRIFNPYSREFEQSIGMDPSIKLSGDFNSICCPLLLKDGTLIGAYAPHLLNRGDVPLISEGGATFVKWEIENDVKFYGYASSMAARGNEIFVNRPDSILQFDGNGALIKVHTFIKQGKLPYCTKNQFSDDEDVVFFHYLLDSTDQQPYVAGFSLAPNANEFKSVTHPNFKNRSEDDLQYRAGNLGIAKIGKDYWKSSLWDMALMCHRPNAAPVNYFDFIRAKYPELKSYQKLFYDVMEDVNGHAIWAVSRDLYGFSNIDQAYSHYWSGDDESTSCEGQKCVMRGITEDNRGNIYIGHGLGIKILNKSTGATSDLNFELQNQIDYIHSLTHVNGKLYANAFEIDIQSGQCNELIPNIVDHRVTHFVDTNRNTIWIANGGAWQDRTDSIEVFQYDLSTNKSKKVTVIRNPKGIFTAANQFHLSPTTQTMFLATLHSGLVEMDITGKVLNQYVDSTYQGLGAFLSLHEDDQQQLWIGHEGLSKLNLTTREFTQHELTTSLNASQPRNIYSIQRQDELYCWLGTGSGIYRLNMQTGACQDFEMIDRISKAEFNRLSHYQDSDGTLYFGSLDGLYTFHPDQFLEAAAVDQVFPISVIRHSTFDKELDSLLHYFHHTSTTYHISPKHKYFSFDVFVPDYRKPAENKYSWWLEGYDKSWSAPTTENLIRYENIPAGTYTLHVKGGLSPSYYQSSEKEYKIVVHQVWYKTNAAILGYIALLSAFIYSIYRYQINKKLAESEAKRLKELDEVKTQLYTNITHEFRTPLTVIMGMTDNIEGHQSEKQLITRNSKNLLRLINQMLDLSKLESGSMSLEMKQSDIVNYLQYLTESFYSMAEEKKIRLMFYPEMKSLIMDFDEIKMQHIIYNLLSNAIKFSDEGDKVVLHASQIDLQDGPLLQLKVQDTGIGMSSEDSDKIFNRFYQAKNNALDEAARATSAGTGIGLALTKELITMMGGSITVESQLGIGTTFTVVLPIVKSQAAIELAAPDLAPNLTVDEIRAGEKAKILIIEDNKDVMTYVTGLLKPTYDIALARNGTDGINQAFEIIPDLIISDVMMPEKDGYEVCQALKRDERTSHIPIILLTAKATTEDRLEGLSEGADAYLIKPFNKQELYIRIEQLLTLRKKLQERFGNFKNVASARPSLDKVFLQKLIDVVDQKLGDSELNVKDLCGAVQLSNMQVNRKLKALTGKTPSGFIRSIRLQKGLELLKATTMNISEIAYSVGFNNPNYFSRAFSQEFGVSPSSIRK